MNDLSVIKSQIDKLSDDFDIILAVGLDRLIANVNNKIYNLYMVYKYPIKDYLYPISDRKNIYKNTVKINNQFNLNILGFELSKFMQLIYNSELIALEMLKSSVIHIKTPQILTNYVDKFNKRKIYHSYRTKALKVFDKEIFSKTDVSIINYIDLIESIINAYYIYKKGKLPRGDIYDKINIIEVNILSLTIRDALSSLITKISSGKSHVPRIDEIDYFAMNFFKNSLGYAENIDDTRLLEKKDINKDFIRLIDEKNLLSDMV